MHLLDWLHQENLIRAIDHHLGLFIAQVDSSQYRIPVSVAAAWVSQALGQQHTCILLDELVNLSRNHLSLRALPQTKEGWLEVFQGASTVSFRQDESEESDFNPGSRQPLMFFKERLYLERYWQYETKVIAQIQKRSQRIHPLSSQMKSRLETLFPATPDIDWQKVAAMLSMMCDFSVITGGPGTGKTTTVAKILALMLEQAPHLNIRIVAPTGKAAARLTESIRQAKSRLDCDPIILSKMPDEASTIHRLLRVRGNTGQFYFHEGNPLHLDVLIIDEASMIDLPLMAKLLTALPANAKVILLGDKDQLASVEAGSVLGEICAGIRVVNGKSCLQLSSEIIHELSSIFPNSFEPHFAPNANVSNGLCLLQKSHRFDANSGIGQLARAVNHHDWSTIQQLYQGEHHFDDICCEPLNTQTYQKMIEQAVECHAKYLRQLCHLSPRVVLQQFQRYQLLCATRQGDFGVEGVNRAIEKRLAQQRFISLDKVFYAGRPVMITQNDYQLGLFNGDIGIILPDQDDEGILKAFFITSKDDIRAILPNRLPAHETVYAMTVHKSQGSEFEHTVMLLPPVKYFSPVITQELIYTGITRAKEKFTLYADLSALRQGTFARTFRTSGLGARLYSTSSIT